MGRPDVLGSIELVEFSFVSRVSPDLPPTTLLRLARQSWSFNLRSGLTGTLRLVGDSFFEEIEGPCDVVQPLAARILGDSRHEAIRISAFRHLDARRHRGWSIAGFDLERESISARANGGAPAFANVCAFRAPDPRPDAPAPSASVGGGLG